MERGVCRIHERLLFTGHSFGEDFQLENPKLRRDEHGAKSDELRSRMPHMAGGRVNPYRHTDTPNGAFLALT